MEQNNVKLAFPLILLAASGLLFYLFAADFFTKPAADSAIVGEAIQKPHTPTAFDLSTQHVVVENSTIAEKSGDRAADIGSTVRDEKIPLTEQEIAQAEFEAYMQQPEQVLWREQTYSNFPEGVNQFIAMDIVELQQYAEDGNVNAMNMFGTRLVRQDIEPYQGIDWLIEAASYGSQEALFQLIWIYRTGAGSIQKDEFASLAWSQVSYMLGNWQAVWPQGRSAMKKMSFRESLLVDVLAANYFAEINRRHLERTGRNIEPNLRPGYAEALDHFMQYGFDDP